MAKIKLQSLSNNMLDHVLSFIHKATLLPTQFLHAPTALFPVVCPFIMGHRDPQGPIALTLKNSLAMQSPSFNLVSNATIIEKYAKQDNENYLAAKSRQSNSQVQQLLSHSPRYCRYKIAIRRVASNTFYDRDLRCQSVPVFNGHRLALTASRSDIRSLSRRGKT
jgi:hypothetical protein